MVGFHHNDSLEETPRRVGSRNFWFVISSIACLIVGLMLVYTTRGIVAAREQQAGSLARQAELKRAAHQWAVHKALAESESGTTVDRQRLSALEAIAKQRLNVEDPAPKSDPSDIYEYLADPNSPPAQIGYTLVRGGATVLLYGAVLLLLAIPLLPIASAIGQKIAETPFKTGEASGAAPRSLFSWAAISAGLGAGRQVLLPGVLAAGAALAIGAIAISIPSMSKQITAEVHDHGANIDLEKLGLVLEPGTVRVTPQMLQEARLDPQMPPLRFELPAVQVDDQSLRSLIQALASYQQTLAEQQEYRRATLAMMERVRELERQNGQLTATLEERPTQEKLQQLLETLNARKPIDQSIATSLESFAKQNEALANQAKALAENTGRQGVGTTLSALQYTRALNAQNDRLFNQLFRPRLIRKNCETYTLVSKQFKDQVPEQCVDWSVPGEIRSWFVRAESLSRPAEQPTTAVAANK